MQITPSIITKLNITQAKGRDHTFSLTIDSIAPHKGSVSLDSERFSWSGHWSAMPQASVLDFFSSAPSDYLLGAMADIASHVSDGKGFRKKTLTKLLKLRRVSDLEREEAREIFVFIKHTVRSDWMMPSMMTRIWGEEWWHFMASAPNPLYTEALALIETAQAAVAQYRNQLANAKPII